MGPLWREAILAFADGKHVVDGVLVRTNNLDLDIYLNKPFRQRVDFDKTRIDSAVEATELGDQADIALTDWLVRVGTDNTAWNGA